MRRRVRLTGRRQLSKSSAAARILGNDARKWIELKMKDGRVFQVFPPDARIKLRLIENKRAEVIDFGTIGNPKLAEELKNHAFAAPSCQLRIVSGDTNRKGLLLGSTDSWTLRDEPDPQSDGILVFQQSLIRPEIWKLEIRDDEYPIVYFDDSIPNSAAWVRSDPVFLGCVLPVVVRQVFEEILHRYSSDEEIEWIEKWLQWAEYLIDGEEQDPARQGIRRATRMGG